MDRKISEKDIKMKRNKRLIKILLAVAVVVVLFIMLVNFLRLSISKDSISISTVDLGVIEVTVSSTGKVHPLYEEVITSPVISKVLDVYKKAGDSLNTEDIILRLDLEAMNTDWEKQNDELSMKRYRLDQLKTSTQSILSDLAMQIQIEEKKLKRMEVLLRNEKYLDSIGASTQDKIKQTELEYEVDKLRLEQLKLKLENQKASSVADIKISELDYNINLKNINLTSKTKAESQIKSPRPATLIWVNDQIGSTVSSGTQLAIIADLKNYKVIGEISENYGGKVNPGNKAIIRIGNKKISGIIGNVVPSVNNGVINFTVNLDDPSNTSLRSGLKVDVYIVNSLKDNMLRIDNRSFYKGEGEYDLWVINGNYATKRKVILGESNFEKVEVKEGLRVGDQVIVSDMNKLNDESSIRIH